MHRLGSIALVLSLLDPSFAVDDVAEALADSSGKPGLTSESRIALKLLGGTVAGVGTATAVLFVSFATYGWCTEDWCSEDRNEDQWSDRLAGVLLVSSIPIGMAAGVSAFDQHDHPVYPLAASLLGFGAGLALDVASAEIGGSIVGATLWLPVIAATVASEWSRAQLSPATRLA